MSIMRTASAAVLFISALAAPVVAPPSANAMPIDSGVSIPAPIEHVAQGRGPDGWRGPYGGCNYPRGRWGSHWGCPPGCGS